MAETFFDNPPALRGDEKNQLVQLQAYLMAMSDKLNQALMNITIEQMEPESRLSIQKITSGDSAKEQTQSLKTMIVKTAEIVRSEMQQISTELHGEYIGLSEQFGSYENSLDATITATAEGILQDYNFEERISGLEDETGNTDVFMRRINQYIFSGLVDEVNGKYGIAIGENITGYDEHGNPYINSDRKMATFTMDRLSFWQGDVEMAYFSDNTFHITNGEITKLLKMGNFTWSVMEDDSIGLAAISLS